MYKDRLQIAKNIPNAFGMTMKMSLVSSPKETQHVQLNTLIIELAKGINFIL
jgi:hypothetical protein